VGGGGGSQQRGGGRKKKTQSPRLVAGCEKSGEKPVASSKDAALAGGGGSREGDRRRAFGSRVKNPTEWSAPLGKHSTHWLDEKVHCQWRGTSKTKKMELRKMAGRLP